MKISALNIILTILLSACSVDSTKIDKQTYRICNGAEPETINPLLATGVTENRIIRAIFEGLTSLHPKTMKAQPGCANWTVSEDKKTYTFIINKNAKWSDGTELSADDFIYSWKRTLSREEASSYASMFFHIENAEKFYKKEITDFGQVGIKKINAKTIKFLLTNPVNYFTELTAFPVFYPLNKKCIETYGNSWTRPENIISNGAFIIKEWLPRQKIRVEKSPHYHDAENVSLKAAEFLPYDNLETSYQLFLNGKIDWLPGVPLDKSDEIKYNPDYYVNPYLGTYFYRFNCSRPPFNNPKVRRAFALATNREIITEQILKGGEIATTSFCPQMPNYEPVKGVEYNPKRAKELLFEAGYGANNPFPEVELLYNTSENHKKIAEAIVEQWRNSLGVKVSLRNSEWKTYLVDQKNLKYDISRSSWIGDYNDPETFLELMSSENGNNRTGWKNKEYDKLLDESRKATSEERLKIFAKMEKMIIKEELPIIPIYSYVSRGFISERIDGWYENILDIHPLKYIKIIELEK